MNKQQQNNDTPMTATEILLRKEEWDRELRARRNRYGMMVNKMMGKQVLKMMTNMGPVLGIVNSYTIVNRIK